MNFLEYLENSRIPLSVSKERKEEVEEESKMSFWKKWKTSIFGLEEYQKLALQKVTKTIGYLAILMLIFAFFLSIAVTYQFHKTVDKVAQYIDKNIEIFEFKQGSLQVKAKDKPEDEPIVIDEKDGFYGKMIIDTKDLSQEQIEQYEEEVGSYVNGILVLKDKIILKTSLLNGSITISLNEVAEKIHLVNVEKKQVLEFVSGSQMLQLDCSFLVAFLGPVFVWFFCATLMDAVIYSIIAYTVGIFSRLRLKYSAAYNIAAYGLSLSISLNIIYAVINILTGYTIKYFSIMYSAITCIYIMTAILMIKSDVIKKQIELSKIIAEQEKVRQEMERREQEKKEEEEKERQRKEEEKKREEEKKEGKSKEEGSKMPKENGEPEPQANIELQ